MIYGPFNLSDAGPLEISFWMWWETEPDYDNIFVEVSRDNLTFDELGRWNGTSGSWQQITISTDAYAGDGSVWVSWRFTSNASKVFDGPWVDDITVKKLTFGYVTVHGYIYYSDRYGNNTFSPYTTIELWEHDPINEHDDLLITANTDENGYFLFPAIMNFDPDDNNYIFDLYITIKTTYADSESSIHKVTNFYDQTYQWTSETWWDISDGEHAFTQYIPAENPITRAIWVFQDLRNAWEYIRSNTFPPIDAGSVKVKYQIGENCYTNWPSVCGSFFYSDMGTDPFIFISEEYIISSDTIVHETGHNFMYNANGFWWWFPTCWGHSMYSEIDANCAWSEGWADYFPLAVNNDPCYDFGRGSCGAYPGFFYNLELIDRNYLPPNYPWGDLVEGRVAGALYDLFGSSDDGYDSADFGFDPIADIIYYGTTEESFYGFWLSWKDNGYNHHNAVRAIYQNTIIYNWAPYFSTLLPDLQVTEGNPRFHVIDLWDYTDDFESQDAELTYELTYVSTPLCGIEVDDHWINVIPEPDWIFTCTAIVRVSDSLMYSEDTFQVNTIPVVDTKYLPITYFMFSD